MKSATLFVVLLVCFSPLAAFSQHSDEDLIRQLEDKEREAILKSDTTQLSNLMSRGIVVQNPENAIVGFRQIMERIKAGKINYSKFERKIDNIAFVNGIAVVMGLEVLVPEVIHKTQA